MTRIRCAGGTLDGAQEGRNDLHRGSIDNPAEYVLVEAFRDGDAGAAHVNSDHFKAARRDLPQALAHTPNVISQTIDATGWSKLAEISVD